MDSNRDGWYPPEVTRHEMSVGIVRDEVNEMVYVACDWPVTSAKLDRAKEKRENDYRLWVFSKTPQKFSEWMREREANRR